MSRTWNITTWSYNVFFFFWHEVLKICLGCSNIGHMLSFISSAPTHIIKNIIFHKIYEYHLCYIIILHVFMINKQQLSLSLARVCISVLIYAYLCLLDLEYLPRIFREAFILSPARFLAFLFWRMFE